MSKETRDSVVVYAGYIVAYSALFLIGSYLFLVAMAGA
jgi:hypothetical protein